LTLRRFVPVIKSVAQVTGAEHLRRLDQMRIDEARAAIGIDQARRKGAGSCTDLLKRNAP